MSCPADCIFRLHVVIVDLWAGISSLSALETRRIKQRDQSICPSTSKCSANGDRVQTVDHNLDARADSTPGPLSSKDNKYLYINIVHTIVVRPYFIGSASREVASMAQVARKTTARKSTGGKRPSKRLAPGGDGKSRSICHSRGIVLSRAPSPSTSQNLPRLDVSDQVLLP